MRVTDSDKIIEAADREFEHGLFKEAHINYGKALSLGTTRENYCRRMRGMCSRRVAEQRLQKARDNPGGRHAYILQSARWLAKAEANLESALEEANVRAQGQLRMEQALTEDAIAEFMVMTGGNPDRRRAEAERYRHEAARLLGADTPADTFGDGRDEASPQPAAT